MVAQAPPLAASPPTPEEATQRLQEALASSDEAAAALALEALEGLDMTKAALRSTGTMCLPNTHANTHAATTPPCTPSGAGKVVNALHRNKDMPEALRSRAKELVGTWKALA